MKDKKALETDYQKIIWDIIWDYQNIYMGYAGSAAWKVQICIAHSVVESLITE